MMDEEGYEKRIEQVSTESNRYVDVVSGVGLSKG